MTDYEYVDYVERLANQAIGPYTKKEHAKKRQSLGDAPRLNRVFDLMNIEYPEREDPVAKRKREQAIRATGGRVPRGHSGRGRGVGRGRGRGQALAVASQARTAKLESQKRKVISDSPGSREPKYVKKCREIAKPVGQLLGMYNR